MRKLFFVVALVLLLSLTNFKSTVKADVFNVDEELKQVNDNNENDFISSMTTEELINKIVNDELYKIYLFSNVQTGIAIFKANNPYYLVLKEKNDIKSTLDHLYLNNNSEEIKERLNILYSILSRDGFRTEGTPVYDVFTPNGSLVDEVYYDNRVMSLDDVQDMYEHVIDDYPLLASHYLYRATYAFNCHSYAWYSQDFYTNERWLDSPNSYIDDYSYEEVYDVRPGDIFCYCRNVTLYDYNNQPIYSYCDIYHSAIVADFTNDFDLLDESTYQHITLISKWGIYGVFEHAANYCYYFESDHGYQFAKVYRPRVSESISLSSPSGNNVVAITKTMVVPENALISQQYALYEINVPNSLDFTFSSSSSGLSTMKLYDIHMQPLNISLSNEIVGGVYTVSFLEKLTPGTYYLRVCYLNSSDYGTITTSINYAYHNIYSYVWRDFTFHDEMCTFCGANPATHVVSINEFKKKPPKFYTCMICGGPASAYTPFYGKSVSFPHTTNGSILLPNGIIILVDEDLDAYFEGNLLFIIGEKEEKNIVLYLEKKNKFLNIDKRRVI